MLLNAKKCNPKYPVEVATRAGDRWWAAGIEVTTASIVDEHGLSDDGSSGMGSVFKALALRLSQIVSSSFEDFSALNYDWILPALRFGTVALVILDPRAQCFLHGSLECWSWHVLLCLWQLLCILMVTLNPDSSCLGTKKSPSPNLGFAPTWSPPEQHHYFFD